MFTRQLVAGLLSFTELADIEISMHDVVGARLGVAEASARQVNAHCGPRAAINMDFGRKAALVGSEHAMGLLPTQRAALNRPYLSVAELTIEGAQTVNPRMIHRAILMDPNAGSALRPDQIWDMCNELVRVHGDLLPEALRVDVATDAL